MSQNLSYLRELAGLKPLEESTLSKDELEKLLYDEMNSDDEVYFDHGHKMILWFDENDKEWNINYYRVNGDKVDIDAMPTFNFKK